MSLLTLDRRVPSQTSTPFLASGFRPFFLGAALYAALGVPFWVATLVGSTPFRPPENPLDWHAHEMVFGFAGAVMAGFLLTAIRRWTGRTTIEGTGLAALFFVWLSARVLPFVPVSGHVAACADLAFWLGLHAACTRPILLARNRRNYGFPVLLAGFSLAAAVSHANRLCYLQGDFWAVRTFGVDLVTVAMVVMTGRVVPSFTRNATQASDISDTPRHDRAATIAVALVVVLDAVSAPQAWSALLAGIAGALALARARHWGARHALGQPLLWILHLGHAWVAVGLLLRGLLPLFPGLPASVALHAVTAGGIGILSFGMMTRVTLGHTGRLLAVPRVVTAAMAALALGAALRVLGPVVLASHLSFVLAVAGGLWSLAFATYLACYARALATPRVDGLPG